MPFINTASSAGGDGTTDATTGANRAYVSFSEFNTQETDDLVAAGAGITVECNGSGGADTAGDVRMTGWTTNASFFITVNGNRTGHTYRAVDDANGYRVEFTTPGNYDRGIQFSEHYTVVNDLQIEITSSNKSYIAYYFQGDFPIVRRSIAKGVITTGASGINGGGFHFVSCDSGSVFANLAIDFTEASNAGFKGANGSGTQDWYNNTAHNCAMGFRHDGLDTRGRNLLAQNCTDGFDSTAYWVATTSHNCSDLTSDLPGANGQVGDVLFTDEANDDFELDASDTVALGNGVDLSGTFDFDLANNAMPTNWPIGCMQEAVAGGDIAAALTLVLTVAADLDAQGKLDAALPLAVTVAADLDAQGKLDAALSLVLAVAADLDAQGKLDAALSLVLTVAADLKAAGQLDAALNLVLTQAADLKAAGQLDAALSLVLTVAADLTAAAGQLDAVLSLVLTQAADLKAAGQLDAVLSLVLTVAADLNAAGELDALLPIILSVIADLKGAGELSAIQSIILTIAADLTAVGSLSAAALIALTVAAELDAEGQIQAALAIVLSVAADLDAPGSLSAALGIVLTVAADLTAAGELQAAANIILTVVAQLTEESAIDLQAALDIVLSVVADLDAVGQLTANMQIVLTMAADLKAAGDLQAALALVLTVAAGLTATGNLGASLLIRLTISADLQDTPVVPPAPPVQGGSPAKAGPPTITLTEQQVVQRQLLREDDETMSVVLTALGLIRK